MEEPVTITMTAMQWWLLLALAGGSVALLFGMFAYVLKVGRAAYLGDSWIEAAGSYGGAVRALDRYNAQTDAMIARGMLNRGKLDVTCLSDLEAKYFEPDDIASELRFPKSGDNDER